MLPVAVSRRPCIAYSCTFCLHRPQRMKVFPPPLSSERAEELPRPEAHRRALFSLNIAKQLVLALQRIDIVAITHTECEPKSRHVATSYSQCLRRSCPTDKAEVAFGGIRASTARRELTPLVYAVIDTTCARPCLVALSPTSSRSVRTMSSCVSPPTAGVRNHGNKQVAHSWCWPAVCHLAAYSHRQVPRRPEGHARRGALQYLSHRPCVGSTF